MNRSTHEVQQITSEKERGTNHLSRKKGKWARLLGQDLRNHGPKRLRRRGPADPAHRTLARRVDLGDRRLSVDALNASAGDAGECRHLDLTVTGSSKNLSLVPSEHLDPSLFGTASL